MGGQLDDAFSHVIFTSEPLRHEGSADNTPVPAIIKEARKLESGENNSRELFLKQARLLAEFEDDFSFNGNPVRYYSTYQSFNNRELRGYFTWRTKIRRKDFANAPVSFIFLYIYELINLVGVEDASDALVGLLEIYQQYAPTYHFIEYYLEQWIPDFIIYYDLPSELLAGWLNLPVYRLAGALEHIEKISTADLMEAINGVSPNWLARSKFYNEHKEDMAEAIHGALKGMAAHYSASCKRRLVEQYFGSISFEYYPIFKSAVFCDPLKRKNYEYSLDNQWFFRCKDGVWSVTRREISYASARKFQKLLKTIDGIMREEYSYGHPIQMELKTQWIVRLIREEIRALAARKEEAAKREIRIDFSRLAKIRADAEETCEKLAIGEELDEKLPALPGPAVPDGREGKSGDLRASSLDKDEVRLLHSLLYDGNLDWVREQGLMLSVLVDAVNEKLYGIFDDTVLLDGPELVEDYIAELKELVPL